MANIFPACFAFLVKQTLRLVLAQLFSVFVENVCYCEAEKFTKYNNLHVEFQSIFICIAINWFNGIQTALC